MISAKKTCVWCVLCSQMSLVVPQTSSSTAPAPAVKHERKWAAARNAPLQSSIKIDTIHSFLLVRSWLPLPFLSHDYYTYTTLHPEILKSEKSPAACIAVCATTLFRISYIIHYTSYSIPQSNHSTPHLYTKPYHICIYIYIYLTYIAEIPRTIHPPPLTHHHQSHAALPTLHICSVQCSLTSPRRNMLYFGKNARWWHISYSYMFPCAFYLLWISNKGGEENRIMMESAHCYITIHDYLHIYIHA